MCSSDSTNLYMDCWFYELVLQSTSKCVSLVYNRYNYHPIIKLTCSRHDIDTIKKLRELKIIHSI